MAKELIKTPLAEVRWAKLLSPQKQYDETKPLAWSCEILLPNDSKETSQFLLEMEDKLTELHGTTAKKSVHAYPWGPDKEKPKEFTVVRFKLPQFTRRDGTVSEGPVIYDSRKNAWDGKEIGNGSKILVGFDIYPWAGAAGVGMTFQPRAVMVVDLVEYERAKPDEIFETVEGGYVNSEVPF